jgi:hypothetical protein
VCFPFELMICRSTRAGRIFAISFSIVPPKGLPKAKRRKTCNPSAGAWLISLRLLDPSPSTAVTARLRVDPVPSPAAPVDIYDQKPRTRVPVTLVVRTEPGWVLGHTAGKKIADETWADVSESLCGDDLKREYVCDLSGARQRVDMCAQ